MLEIMKRQQAETAAELDALLPALFLSLLDFGPVATILNGQR